MKRMLLASAGPSSSGKIKKLFFELAEKTPKETKVLAMICPRDKSREVSYPKGVIDDLKKCGIPSKNITFANIYKDISAKDFSLIEFDVFLSWGGNTFLILDRIKKTGFDKFIIGLVKQGKFYFGSSAGRIIPFKTIEIAGWGEERDENLINLKNLKGLNLVDLAIYPHYHKELKKEIREMKKKAGYQIKEIKDGEAILFLGNSRKIIS